VLGHLYGSELRRTVVARRPGREGIDVLGLSWDAVRLFLHVLAATIWVGGQLALAALVPTLRALGADLPRRAAQAFNRIAWPAFGVLIATGGWNLAAEHDKLHGPYLTTVVVKLVVVATSGLTALLHACSHSKIGLATFGALTAVTALLALLLGVVLAG
jgi:putative copper export protein